VVENAIGVPQVALPPGAVGTPFPAGTWNMTVQGVVQLTAPATSYTTEFVELDPEDGQFSADLDNPQIEGDELEVDPAAEAEVRKVLDEITDDGDSALQIARKVQGYLRGPTFTYSLELADQAADGNLSDEPLARFLETKRGYCVQFTSAMVMLSRAAGIPARMAVGFLPGSIDGDDRVVKVSDAHAWPELYFPRLGWVRFEPTPGTRSGVAPEYSSEPLNGGSSASASPTTSSSTSSATPSTSPSRDVTADQTGTTTGSAGTGAVRFVTQHVTTILVLLLALLIAAIVPFGAWLSRRRARAAARDDADRVEAEWQSLLLRLQDIGFVPPDGATPRQTSRTIGHDAYLTPDENDALGRVVTTLERARYARPGAELVDVSGDARTVWRGALSRRRRADRARAMLLPEEGKRMWRGLGRSLLFWRDRGPDVPPDD
jgi:transglutaminase-like putative cysteine protease